MSDHRYGMKTIELALIALFATMRISHQQDNDRRSEAQFDRCRRLPKFFSRRALDNLHERKHYRCFKDFVSAESMLKDVSRRRLYEFFKNQSQLLVSGKCPLCIAKQKSAPSGGTIRYRNIFLMQRQNWFLEYSAYYLFAGYNCPLMKTVRRPRFPKHGKANVGTLPDVRRSDAYFTVTSMKITPKGRQIDAVINFTKVMMSAKDLLQTWNETDYILGSASHYGCAVVIRDNVIGISGNHDYLRRERAAYLACVFLAYRRLVSYRGKIDKQSCIRNNGYLEATLCVHSNMRTTTRRSKDIACQENYNEEYQPGTDDEDDDDDDDNDDDDDDSQYEYEDDIDDLRSGLQFFMLLALVAFFLLAIMISCHTTDVYVESESLRS